LELDVELFGNTPVSFQSAAAFTRNKITDEGVNLINTVSSVTAFMKNMYVANYHYKIYVAFERDELFFYYPSYSDIPESYNPLQEDWYHLAKASTPNPAFIEIEQNGLVLNYKISKSIVKETELVGVVCIEFRARVETTEIDAVRFKRSGFAALVSPQGLVISNPYAWENNNISTRYRIFEEGLTGISYSMWQEMIDTETSRSTTWKFTTNNTDFTIMRDFAAYNGETSAVIIGCWSEDEVLDVLEDIRDDISELYILIFTIVLSIAC
jgi:hypothetical protein